MQFAAVTATATVGEGKNEKEGESSIHMTLETKNQLLENNHICWLHLFHTVRLHQRFPNMAKQFLRHTGWYRVTDLMPNVTVPELVVHRKALKTSPLSIRKRASAVGMVEPSSGTHRT